jgi:PAS domain S-box-containing protein
MALMSDVTERTRIQEQLEKSEQQYRDLVEHLPAGAVLLEGEQLFFNHETEKITGYTREEITNVDDWFKTLYVDDHEYIKSLYLEDRAMGFPTERTVTMQRKNGEPRWVTFYAYQFATGEVWLLWDVSQQKVSEEKIYTSIIEGEDRERQRIASELHDGLGQQLTAALLNLQNMGEAVSRLDNDKQVHFNLGLNFLNKAIDETRNIAHNLMPMSIEDFGLIYSLESLFASIRKSTKLEITLYENLGPNRLSKQVETNLFRITQEALNNVIKHSRAKSVSIQLVKHPHSIIYSFEDDGTGFDATTKPEMKTGMGLNNIYNRVKSMSGELNIDSKPGYGTVITIELQQ